MESQCEEPAFKSVMSVLKCTSKVPLDEQGCFLKAPFAQVCCCAVDWRCATMPKLLRLLQRAEAQLVAITTAAVDHSYVAPIHQQHQHLLSIAAVNPGGCHG
jgi:hypothetical protein